MCWSLQASAAVATVGTAGTVYAIYKREDKALWAPLLYFTLMEWLQAYTYHVIDKCNDPANQIATLLGYLHISFQMFFINMISLYFVPKNMVNKIAPFVYTICFVGTILMLIDLYPFSWAKHCIFGSSILCGKGNTLCSIHGQWHIAWELPLSQIINKFIAYGIPAFIVPLLYGSWRFTLYHVIMGPLLSWLLTNNINEFAAVWCLLSIGFLLLVVKTPLRQLLFVRKWYFWNYPQFLIKDDKPWI